MADTPERVDFLRDLARRASRRGSRAARARSLRRPQLDAWDVAYYAERLQQKQPAAREEELRPYFPLPRVLEGLFAVAGELFGVAIVERPTSVWHPT